MQGQEQQALSLLEPELPPFLTKSDSALRRKLIQAAALGALSRLSEAEKQLAEAEALAKEYHPELLGEVSLRTGTLHFRKGEITEAEAAYKKTLQLSREQKDQFLEADALSGLGLATTMEGHYDESIDWNRAAEKLATSLGAAGTLAKTLGNLGWSYRELGDYENALRYYEEAEEASTKSGLLADQTYWLTTIAWARQGLGDDSGAEGILNRALPLARAQGDKGTLAQCLNQLTWIALRTGRNDLAGQHNQEAVELQREGIGPIPSIDSTLLRGLIAGAKRNYAEEEKSLRLVVQDPQANKYQQWKAQAELAKVYANESQDTKAEEEFLRCLETMEDARASIQSEEYRLFFLSNTIVFYSDFVDFLMSRHRVLDGLEVAELSRARTLTEGLGTVSKTLSFPLSNFHPRELARRRNAVFLVYWLAPKQSYIWAITPSKINSFRTAKQSEIENLVSNYRKAMQDGKDLLAGNNLAGQKLYDTLVAPAKQMIPQGSRVIVLPDAKLYGLNFEALISPEPEPHYWLEDVTISTASSLTLLASSNAPSAKTGKRLLLVGNAVPPNSDFPALTQAPVEMKNIEQYFPDANRTILEGKQATPAAYLASHPEKFSHMHFVTHGTASLTHPLESAVILSPDGADGGFYKLYARDIVQHPIRARLVTISACKGAGGSYSGEGLVGLSWAFVRAGAHNVISALWEVSDSSAPQLMDSLYSELSQGKDPATALRNAKLAMLHSHSNDVFKKPYYWAPFQLYAGP